MHLKMAKRRLNEKQERDVALLRICGVNLHNIEEEYGIAKSTVEHNIILRPCLSAGNDLRRKPVIARFCLRRH